ncbi:MAG: Ig domain-containing protein [Clostridia bacterium]|nr:Ig domain-containing protein [Clostridia bacterium]
MKKRLLQAFVMMLLLTLVMGTTTTAFAAATPKLNTTKATIAVGKTKTLKAYNVGGQTVTWTTSNSKVATVSTKGVVTGIKAGTATITAKAGTIKLKATIKVEDKAALNATSVALNAGKTKKLKVSNAAGRSLTWKSSKPAVAAVDSNGLITAYKEGTATITCQVANGKKLKATVTVKEIAAINAPAKTLIKGEKMTLKVTNLFKRNVTWKSSNTSVATVSAKGVVKSVGIGKTTISAQIENSKKLTLEVEVLPAVSFKEVTLSYSEAGSKTLRYSLTNNTDKEIRYVKYVVQPYYGTTKLTAINSEYNAPIASKGTKSIVVDVDVSTSRAGFTIKEVVYADGTTWKP